MDRSLRLFGRGLCVLVVVLSGLSSTAFAADTSPVIFHLSFRTVSRKSTFPMGSGNYVTFTGHCPCRPFYPVVLLNDATGKRIVVKSTCGSPSAFGAQWLAFDCDATNPKRRFQLYNVHTHQWRRLRCDSACTQYSQYVGIVAVGAKWLVVYYQLPGPCGDGIHNECGPTGYLYYSIATGTRGSPRLGANEFLDLDSPTLASRPCNPVSVPSGSPTIPPTLAFDRGFAFVRSQDGVYVQRCGSPQQTYLTTDPNAYDLAPFWAPSKSFFGNQDAAGFLGAIQEAQPPQAFFGVFLPSLVRFTATGVPEASPGVLLGPHHLYVWSNGKLMAAPFPSRPPAAAG